MYPIEEDKEIRIYLNNISIVFCTNYRIWLVSNDCTNNKSEHIYKIIFINYFVHWTVKWPYLYIYIYIYKRF